MVALWATAGLVAVWSFSLMIYVQTMFDGRWTRENFIDGVSFATQTITTVGYGNWEAPVSGEQVDRQHLSAMRLYSAWLMLLGATLYATFTGLIVAALCPPQSSQ